VLAYFNYLVPQTIKTTKSKINGQIKVVNFLGKPRIIVNGLIQSGGLAEVIWKKGIKNVAKVFKPKKVLILGLGGGTVAGLINQFFPKAEIVGVEIDKKIIDLGKTYFNLDNVYNLKIINQDAIYLVNNSYFNNKTFDLILVDLYIGDQVPLKSESLVFLKNLNKLVSDKGIVVFNRLFYGRQKLTVEKFAVCSLKNPALD